MARNNLVTKANPNLTESDIHPSAKNGINALLRHARRVIVSVVGVTVVLVGIALLFLPGPAFIVIPAGLAILATEFVWAKRLLRKVRDSATDVGKRISGKNSTND
jgi:uncharacterized protein (TIGR02611 family)